MPGGNTTSRARPHRTVRGHAKAYDNHALAGGEFFRHTMTGDEGEYIDPEMGLPFDQAMDGTPPDVDGNAGWKKANEGPGVTRPRDLSGSHDPTPGGGW